jgi:hypothetical protein
MLIKDAKRVQEGGGAKTKKPDADRRQRWSGKSKSDYRGCSWMIVMIVMEKQKKKTVSDMQ